MAETLGATLAETDGPSTVSTIAKEAVFARGRNITSTGPSSVDICPTTAARSAGTRA